RNRRDQFIRIRGGVDEEATAKNRTSFKGIINGNSRPGNHVPVVNISGHADDAVRRPETRLFRIRPGKKLQYRIRPIHMPVDRILIGEHALCESFADNNDGLFTSAVEIVEITAGDDGNTERGKVSGGDGAPLRAGILCAFRVDVAIRGELNAGTGAAIAPG